VRQLWLTLWNRVILENLRVRQIVKKFRSLYGNWKFISVFTKSPQMSLSCARPIQCTPRSFFLKIHLILPSLLSLGLRILLHSAGFTTETIHAPLLSAIHATFPPNPFFTSLEIKIGKILNGELHFVLGRSHPRREQLRQIFPISGW